MQYASHTAAVHQVSFLGPGSSAVASLDVSGAIHVWSRATGTQLQTFVPLDPAEGPGVTSYTAARPPLPSPGAAAAAAGGGLGGGYVAATGGLGMTGSARQTREYVSSAAGITTADSRRASVSTGVYATPAAAEAPLSSTSSAAEAAAGAAGGIQAASGGYWERGCSGGRGWQAIAALPTAQQLAAGNSAAAGSISSLSPGSAGAAGGVMDAAAGGAAALGGPGWPLAGGHMGYTCMVPVDSSSAAADDLLLSGSSGSSGDGCGSNGSSMGLLLAGTADGHVCLLDVETGTLMQDSIACWDPRPWMLSGSSGGYGRGPLPQLQQQQMQANPLQGAGPGPGGLSPAGWDGLGTAADPSTCVLYSLCHSRSSSGRGGSALGSWVGAGSGGGRVTLLDMRAGVVVANWQAHSQRVSQLQSLSGVQGDHLLVSCSADRTMKLWDLRMMPAAAVPHASLVAAGSSGGDWGSSSSSSSLAAPLTTFRSGREGIEGFGVYQDAAIVYGGASIGLVPLELPVQGGSTGGTAAGWPGGLAGQLQHQQGGTVQMVRMTAVRGLGYRGSGGREGLSAAGAGSVVGLGLLPHSKLLVVGTEDGLMRVCR
jgi:hypothetical protein